MTRLFASSGWLAGTREVEGERVEDALGTGALDFTTELRDIGYYALGEEEYDTDPYTGAILTPTRKVSDYYANVRTDTGEALAVVGKRYYPVQHREAFGLIDFLVKMGALTIDRVQNIRGGRRAMVVTRTEDIELVGEPVGVYQAWLNSHDGQSPVMCVTVPTRYFCSNCLRFSNTQHLKGAYKIRHTKSAPANLLMEQEDLYGANMLDVELAELGSLEAQQSMADLKKESSILLSKQDTYIGRLTHDTENLAAIKVSDADFERFLKELAPVPKPKVEWDAERKTNRVLNQRTVNNAEEKQELIRGIYRGEDNLNDIRGTAYGALNAVIQYTDHERRYRTAGSKVESILSGANDNARARNILFSLN